MKHLKTIARKFHESCNRFDAKLLANRKGRKPTKKQLKRIEYNTQFELQWHIALGWLDHKLDEEQVIIAIKRYRGKYER